MALIPLPISSFVAIIVAARLTLARSFTLNPELRSAELVGTTVGSEGALTVADIEVGAVERELDASGTLDLRLQR